MFLTLTKETLPWRNICSHLSGKRGIRPLRRFKRFPMPPARRKKSQNLLPCDSFSLNQTFCFFAVSGKTCAVSDLNHHEACEVPDEALSRDCHHRDEEWNSGRNQSAFSPLVKVAWVHFGFTLTLCLIEIDNHVKKSINKIQILI